MRRLIEQPTNEGQLLHGRIPLGRVTYHLSIYQTFSDRSDAGVHTGLVVEGRLRSVDLIDLAMWHQRRAELTLVLADGRVLQCVLSSTDGALHSTGLGLYVP